MIFTYPDLPIKDSLWIDMLSPNKVEEDQVEACLGLEIPTREEMREIELSSRLYKEDGVLFITANMLAQSDSDQPKYDAVTFVISDKQLITIRYIEPHAFKLFTTHMQKQHLHFDKPTTLFIELLDATVDRLADILEVVGHRLDEYSKRIFQPGIEHKHAQQIDHQQLLQQMGANGDLNAKTRESLVSFNRAVTFFTQNKGTKLDEECQQRLSTISKDIIALSDHANFISSKINFLLDATLGMVSIEQNKIIKIFSVAAVIFLPPTLIASIYGMNFKFMPELSWHGGYLFAISLMLLSAWLPYKYFKRQKWL